MCYFTLVHLLSVNHISGTTINWDHYYYLLKKIQFKKTPTIF